MRESAAAARREGMADAVVLLVARRVTRSTLDDLADGIGVTRGELQDAVRRFRALTAPPALGPEPVEEPRRMARLARVCTEPGCGAVYETGQGMAVHRRAVHGDRVLCADCGGSFSPVGIGKHRSKAHAALVGSRRG